MDKERKGNLIQILDECLEEMLFSGKSVKECMERYSQYADELEPLLSTVLAAHEVASVEPRPEFRTRARYDFNAALREMAEIPARSWFSFTFGWAQAAVSAVIALLITGSGVLAAATNSLPGESLYGVKIFTEKAQATLTFSDDAQITLYTELANRRVDEIAALVSQGKAQEIGLAVDGIETNLSAIYEQRKTLEDGSEAPKNGWMLGGAQDIPPESVSNDMPEQFIELEDDGPVVAGIKEQARSGYLELTGILADAPVDMQPALEEAVAVFIAGYEQAITSAGG